MAEDDHGKVHWLRRGGLPDLQSNGGDGTLLDMERRVTRLEVEFEHVRRDLDEIKTDVKTVLDRLSHMPTVAGLWIMVATVIGVSVAMVGTFIAVLTYLQALGAS